MSTTKICTSCRLMKTQGEFSGNGSRNGKLQKKSMCKVCRSTRKTTGSASTAIRGACTPLTIKHAKKRKTERVEKVAPPVQTLLTDIEENDRYVITYAQNATPVHVGFWAALQRYCTFHGATLIVIPGRYKNPTSIWSQHMEHDEYWADETVPYLLGGRHNIGPNLTVYGDISIQPTAVTPLSGFEVFSGSASAVFGHPKIQLTTVATASRQPRTLLTTGACTVPNYTSSKAGKKADAHHVLGAAVIERRGDLFFPRQINAEDDGSFIELEHRFTPDGVEKADVPEALVCGDIHVDKSVPGVLDTTIYGKDSIMQMMSPKRIVYHDTLDFNVRSHWNIDDPYDRFLRVSGWKHDTVEGELERAIEFIENTPEFAEPIIIQSNHDDAFDRWLKTAQPKLDMANAKFYHTMWKELLLDAEATGEFTPAFELYYKICGHDRAQFVRRNDGYRVCGVELGLHGHKGINGSRGSPLQFSKLGVKTTTAHNHTASIRDENYSVGVTGDVDQGYNDIPSTHAHVHSILYANGKRTLIFVISNGDGTYSWRA